MPVIGIDIGTQSLKAVVMDDSLRLLGSGSVDYRPEFPRPGWAEQDPRSWLAALGPAIATALADARLRPADIAALAVCGQLDGCIATAADGRPLAPAIIWMDRRAAPDPAIDPALIRDRCGLVLDATHMGAKIAWSRRQLDSASAVETWHQPVTFVLAALTGARAISHSLASTTMLYELASADWNDSLLGLFDAGRATLPSLMHETEVAGGLTAGGAAITGLPIGLPVAVGTGDDFANLLGAGLAGPGAVAVSLGTAEAVGAIAPYPAIDHDLLVETHVFPGGGAHLGNPGWLSGGALRWAVGILGLASDGEFGDLAACAPPGCDGLVFLPALSGAMAPKWIAAARGSFVGLTTSHTRAHMARAVLEGTAFAMRDVVDRLTALGLSTCRLRLMGGGARSRLWCRIRADLTGRPTDILPEIDASASGAALIAAVAAGLYPDLGAAVAARPLSVETIEPDVAPRVAYEEAYARYRQLFMALEPTWAAPISTACPSRAAR